jgi:hypothetical protein
MFGWRILSQLKSFFLLITNLGYFGAISPDIVFKNFFKLEEEGKPALLLLPALIAESCVFGSAFGSGCCLVVGFAQAIPAADGLVLVLD